MKVAVGESIEVPALTPEERLKAVEEELSDARDSFRRYQENQARAAFERHERYYGYMIGFLAACYLFVIFRNLRSEG